MNVPLFNGIIVIRPKIIFQKIEEKFPDVNVSFKVNIPSSTIGGMTLLENSILVALCKLFTPKSLFEFGTYLGATTLLLAENTISEANVATVDIEAGDTENGDYIGSNTSDLKVLEIGSDNDTYLKINFQNKGAICIDRAAPEIQTKITRMYQDSKTLDPISQELNEKFDFILIDGGHDFETIKCDTKNALKMIRPNGIIAWHDFESKIHSDVTEFLIEYSKNNRIYHVANSMLAFQLIGNYSDEF